MIKKCNLYILAYPVKQFCFCLFSLHFPPPSPGGRGGGLGGKLLNFSVPCSAYFRLCIPWLIRGAYVKTNHQFVQRKIFLPRSPNYLSRNGGGDVLTDLLHLAAPRGLKAVCQDMCFTFTAERVCHHQGTQTPLPVHQSFKKLKSTKTNKKIYEK